MSANGSPSRWFLKKFFSGAAAEEDEIRSGIPFFYLLTLVLAIVAGWAIYTSPSLRSPGTLAVFVVLMLVHIGLHWLSIWVNVVRKAWVIPYLAVQGLLAFTLTLLMQNPGLGIGLFMALIGELVAILRRGKSIAIGLVIFPLLSALTYLVLRGPQSLGEWAFSVLPVTSFVVVYVLLYSKQIEARSRAQALLAELEDANRRLEQNAQQIAVLTLTTERTRMARELHDTLAQGLAGLILQLEAADSHLANHKPERAQNIVRQAMERARLTLGESRRVIDDLRQEPALLEEQLRAEAQRFQELSKIPCEVRLNYAGPVSSPLQQQITRFVSECLFNVAQHARAKQAWVSLDSQDGEIVVAVRDDGAGFLPEQAPAGAGHYGLVGLGERARLLGGSLRVHSAPGQGAEITLRLPLVAPEGE